MAKVEAADVDAANRVLEALGLPMRVGAMPLEQLERTRGAEDRNNGSWPPIYGSGLTEARMVMVCSSCGGRGYQPGVSIKLPPPDETDYPETNAVLLGRCEDCGFDLSLRLRGSSWDETVRDFRGVQLDAAPVERQTSEQQGSLP